MRILYDGNYNNGVQKVAIITTIAHHHLHFSWLVCSVEKDDEDYGNL